MIDSGGADAAAAYEQLRREVLQGLPHGGHVGLILLMREGVTAWIDRCARVIAPAASTNAHRVALPDRSPQLHAGIVDVLVNIALTTREEVHP